MPLRERIYAPQLHENILIETHFPPGFTRLSAPFPAVVLNDCQNCWTERGSYGGWHTDRIAWWLYRKGLLRPVVLIGVYPPNWRDRSFGPPPRGRIDRYADFLSDTLLPIYRKRFGIHPGPEGIACIGASYGANAALGVGILRPDAVGNIGAMSAAPHFGKPLPKWISERRFLPLRRLWIDAGNRWAYDDPYSYDGDETSWNRNLIAVARRHMHAGRFRGRIWPGHFHNEEWWRKRIGKILHFFFGRRP